MSIRQFTNLFSLIGATYGGDGVQTFALPNLNGRAALGQGQLTGGGNYPMGSAVGTATVTLTTQQMAAHVHTMPAGASGSSGTTPSPTTYLSATPSEGHGSSTPVYASPATQQSTPVTMANGEAGVAGGSQSHNNVSPYLALQYCMAVQGIFPSRQ